ncbi:hypothetical protein Tco_0961117 [Tanacetum coccineum]
MSTSQDLRDSVFYAISPPDTRARISSASSFPKCQEQCSSTVVQILKDLSARSRIQLILSSTNLYLNKLAPSVGL